MTDNIGTAVLPDTTGEIIHPEDHGNIPLAKSNPLRGELTNLINHDDEVLSAGLWLQVLL